MFIGQSQKSIIVGKLKNIEGVEELFGDARRSLKTKCKVQEW